MAWGGRSAAWAWSLGFASRECLYVVSRERVATNSPVAAFDFFDNHPGHRAHVLVFDGYHGVGEPADHLLLLRWRENAFNQFYIYQGHRFSPMLGSELLW